METKELKIQVPKGYEIDKENSTFKCIKFKPIKKYITYEDVCNTLFMGGTGYFTNLYGEINFSTIKSNRFDINNATNKKQLKRLLALNQLLNIAEYYNNKTRPEVWWSYRIVYFQDISKYEATEIRINRNVIFGNEIIFNQRKDAQAVIDNPNFQEILDTIYKN